MNCKTPGLTVHHQLLSSLKLTSTKSVMSSSLLIVCCPLLLLPSIFPSIRVFSNESAFRIRRPKYWSFTFSISPSSEYSGLISFRIDWFDLLTVQGTLKSLLQHQFKSILYIIILYILLNDLLTNYSTLSLDHWEFTQSHTNKVNQKGKY